MTTISKTISDMTVAESMFMLFFLEADAPRRRRLSMPRNSSPVGITSCAVLFLRAHKQRDAAVADYPGDISDLEVCRVALGLPLHAVESDLAGTLIEGTGDRYTCAARRHRILVAVPTVADAPPEPDLDLLSRKKKRSDAEHREQHDLLGRCRDQSQRGGQSDQDRTDAEEYRHNPGRKKLRQDQQRTENQPEPGFLQHF